jgi:hypothetical protein
MDKINELLEKFANCQIDSKKFAKEIIQAAEMLSRAEQLGKTANNTPEPSKNAEKSDLSKPKGFSR